MSVVTLGTKAQYFGGALHELGFPEHPLLSDFTLVRWEQIKRFIHIENPEADYQEDSQNRIWYHKVGWLVDHIGEVVRQLRDPGSVLSYDEAMVRFSGRASEVVRAPNKPISKGYEVITLCSPDGYVYAFYLRSALHRGPGERFTLSSQDLRSAFPLNETNKIMVYLLQRVPTLLQSEVSRETVVVADNRFWNVPVMAFLRYMNIGGLGTFRVNAKGLPAELKRAISESKESVKSNRSTWAQKVSYVVPSTLGNRSFETLITLWIDQNVVSMMSTVHTLNRTDDFVFRVRKRPRGSSTNARSARMPFGDQPTARLPIPKMVNDYNQFMGGVDSFDQRRAAFDMRLKSRRTWMPLFQFLLDVAVVNTTLLSREVGLASQKCTAEIRMSIARVLVMESRAMRNPLPQNLPSLTDQGQGSRRRRSRVRSVLPARRLDPGMHSAVRAENRERCELCKTRLKARGESTQKGKRSFMRCTYCDVALCAGSNRACFEEFHRQDCTIAAVVTELSNSNN